jgi:hypothetical protein
MPVGVRDAATSAAASDLIPPLKFWFLKNAHRCGGTGNALEIFLKQRKLRIPGRFDHRRFSLGGGIKKFSTFIFNNRIPFMSRSQGGLP